MATIDQTASAANGRLAGHRGSFLLENRIDFTEVDGASGNVIQALEVQAGWGILGAVVDVETVSTGTGTVAVSGASTTLAAYAPTSAGMTAATAGGLQTAVDTIDVTVATAAITDAVIVVRALVCDYNGAI